MEASRQHTLTLFCLQFSLLPSEILPVVGAELGLAPSRSIVDAQMSPV